MPVNGKSEKFERCNLDRKSFDCVSSEEAVNGKSEKFEGCNLDRKSFDI